jgi:hypothetical protein
MNRASAQPSPDREARRVSVPGGQGVLVGDHGVQINYFAESRETRRIELLGCSGAKLPQPWESAATPAGPPRRMAA